MHVDSEYHMLHRVFDDNFIVESVGHKVEYPALNYLPTMELYQLLIE